MIIAILIIIPDLKSNLVGSKGFSGKIASNSSYSPDLTFADPGPLLNRTCMIASTFWFGLVSCYHLRTWKSGHLPPNRIPRGSEYIVQGRLRVGPAPGPKCTADLVLAVIAWVLSEHLLADYCFASRELERETLMDGERTYQTPVVIASNESDVGIVSPFFISTWSSRHLG